MWDTLWNVLATIGITAWAYHTVRLWWRQDQPDSMPWLSSTSGT